jgi:hypothetical protein
MGSTVQYIQYWDYIIAEKNVVKRQFHKNGDAVWAGEGTGLPHGGGGRVLSQVH